MESHTASLAYSVMWSHTLLGIQCHVESHTAWHTVSCGVTHCLAYSVMWSHTLLGIQCHVESHTASLAYSVMWSHTLLGIQCHVESHTAWHTVSCGVTFGMRTCCGFSIIMSVVI